MEAVPTLRAANLGWRVAQGLTYDLVISAAALIVAVWCGIVPVPRVPSLDWRSLTSPFYVLNLVLAVVPRATAAYAIYWVFKLLYHTSFLTLFHGQTPACMLFRVKIVMKSGAAVTWRAALARTIAGGVMGQLPLIGQTMRAADYLAALFNRRKQALRDMAAGTMLVHTIA